MSLAVWTSNFLLRTTFKVVLDVSDQVPEQLVEAYLKETLETGDNICDH